MTTNGSRTFLAALAILVPLALAASDLTQDRIIGELMATAGIPGMEAAVVTADHTVTSSFPMDADISRVPFCIALRGPGKSRIASPKLFSHTICAILKPLGMVDSSYTLAGRPAARFGVGYASVQNKDHSFHYEPASAYWGHRNPNAPVLDHTFTCPDYPSGCLHTTAHDFALLLQMFLAGGTINGIRILDAESVHLMSSPSGFRNLDGWMQGLGMNGPLDHGGRQLWGRDGIDRGVATIFYFNPATHIGVVAMANANNPDFTLSCSLLDIGMHLMSRFEPL